MPRTRDQSNILNGGQIIKNKSTTEPSLTVTGEWGTDADAEIRLENYEGAVSFANQLRSLDGRLPAPNASISYNLDPAANGNPLAGSRKNDTLELMIRDLNSSDEKMSVLAIEAEGTIKFNGRHLVQLIGNDDPDFSNVAVHKFYVATNGNDETGNGSLSKPWATPHRAMELVDGIKIDNDAIVEINIGAGTYIFNTPIIVSHPDGNRIHFVGETPFVGGGKIAGFPVGNWDTSRSNPTIIAGPQYSFSNTAGLLPSTNSSNVATSGTTVTNAIDADRNANEGLITGSKGFKTIFKFISDGVYGLNGFVAVGGNIGLIDNIAIIGDGKGQEPERTGKYDAAGIVAQGHAISDRKGASTSITVGSNVAVHNFAKYGILAQNSNISCLGDETEMHSGVTITGCGVGIQSSFGGTVFCPGITIQGCYSDGIVCTDSAAMWCPEADISGCGGYGIVADRNGSLYANYQTRSTGNYAGYYISGGSSYTSKYVTAEGNRSLGLSAVRHGSIRIDSCRSYGNATHGVYATVNASIHQDYDGEDNNPAVSPPRVYNNGGYGAYAAHNSSILLANTQIFNNAYSGIRANHTSVIVVDGNTNVDSTQRTWIQDNGNQIGSAWVGAASQVVATWGSEISCQNSVMKDLRGTYPVVISTDFAVISLSHTSYPSTISGKGSTVRVYAYNMSLIYCQNSNLKDSTSAFSPKQRETDWADTNYNSQII